MGLLEVPLCPVPIELPPRAQELIREGLIRARAIDCFDFVPCDYSVFYRTLSALPRGVFCEWGSGIGIATALAELLGFRACGIEIHAELAAASRRLLADQGFEATIETGDYLLRSVVADVYYAYCWPGQMLDVQRRFLEIASPAARLLLAYGAEDIRCLAADSGT
jgi:protein-L-isoaspartate O-methyltransferase